MSQITKAWKSKQTENEEFTVIVGKTANVYINGDLADWFPADSIDHKWMDANCTVVAVDDLPEYIRCFA